MLMVTNEAISAIHCRKNCAQHAVGTSGETQKKGKRAEWQGREGKEERGARVHVEGEKNEERVSCAREGAHDFSFPRRAVKIARVQPPPRSFLPPYVVLGKLAAVLPP